MIIEFLSGLLEGRPIPVYQYQLCSLPGNPVGDGPPQAGRRSGNQYYLLVKSHRFVVKKNLPTRRRKVMTT